MKTLISLLALVSLPALAETNRPAPAQPADMPLIVANQSPGFVMNPEHREFTLTSQGKLLLTIRYVRENRVEQVVLGKLSKTAMDSIAKKIAAIDPNLPLVDAQEGQPQCTDTPYTNVRIVRAGVSKDIYRDGGCHEWNVADYEAQGLAAFARTFLNF